MGGLPQGTGVRSVGGGVQTYQKLSKIILSTSTLASPALDAGGFGPVNRDCYGIGYGIVVSVAESPSPFSFSALSLGLPLPGCLGKRTLGHDSLS
jgi:hypothetical protein